MDSHTSATDPNLLSQGAKTARAGAHEHVEVMRDLVYASPAGRDLLVDLYLPRGARDLMPR
jgi:hypothetical protein